MVDKNNSLLIVGDGEFAQIAYEYFTYDSDYEIVAFSVENEFLKRERLFDLPVVPFEELEHHYDPTIHKVFVAVTQTPIRQRLYEEVKIKGFCPISYVSSKAFVSRSVQIGENCFVFENSAIQKGTNIGNNVIIWAGSVVGHSTTVKDNAFLAPNVTICGFCEIGDNAFLGANSTIVTFKKIGRNCIVGAGAVVIGETEEGSTYVGNPARRIEGSTTCDTIFKQGEILRDPKLRYSSHAKD
jgi:sugar O-acyltransferase (sialic acid O-acetyltransferase NeuD family)